MLKKKINKIGFLGWRNKVRWWCEVRGIGPGTRPGNGPGTRPGTAFEPLSGKMFACTVFYDNRHSWYEADMTSMFSASVWALFVLHVVMAKSRPRKEKTSKPKGRKVFLPLKSWNYYNVLQTPHWGFLVILVSLSSLFSQGSIVMVA